MNQKMIKFIKDEEGLTMVEYAIAGGLVGAGGIAAFALLGGQVTRIITAIMNALAAVVIN